MKHNIDVEGLPEGWKAVAYRKAKKGEWNFMEYGDPFQASQDHETSSIIVQKIQPRRIVPDLDEMLASIYKYEYGEGYRGGKKVLQNDKLCELLAAIIQEVKE